MWFSSQFPRLVTLLFLHLSASFFFSSFSTSTALLFFSLGATKEKSISIRACRRALWISLLLFDFIFPFIFFLRLTQAALMGGTTMVMALVLPEQHCSLVDAYENCRALADAKACCDYALHVGLTWWGPKVNSKQARHLSGNTSPDFNPPN